MHLIKLLLFSILFQLNGGENEKVKFKNDKKLNRRKDKDWFSKFMFADVPDFDVEFVYEETYHPDLIANQLLQNLFNWFSPAVFWFTFLSFYNRLAPIFAPANNLRQNEKLFGDVPIFNVTEIYQTTFSPEGVLIQEVQNFFFFFASSMFWLAYVPFYERLFPIFDTLGESEGTETATLVPQTRIDEDDFNYEELSYGGQPRVFVDTPQFNSTFIYYGTFSPTGVAIQLLQNFFNWLSTTVFWLSYTPFYKRLHPIFAPSNNQRSLEDPVKIPEYVSEDQVVKAKTKRKTPFKLIEHMVWFFYGDEAENAAPFGKHWSNSGGENEGEARFGDSWTFNMTTVYETTFSPEGIMIQMVQNFFMFVSNTMFWLSYLPFYDRLFPVFDEGFDNETGVAENNFNYKFSLDKLDQKFVLDSPRDFQSRGKILELSFGRFSNLLQSFADFFEGIQSILLRSYTYGKESQSNLRKTDCRGINVTKRLYLSSNLFNQTECSESDWQIDIKDSESATIDDNEDGNKPRLFGDVPEYNVTDIYNSLSPDGIMQLNLQNFFNFFLSTMFWLTYIPFYERLFPIFVGSNQSHNELNRNPFYDVPDFNVTSIYEETYLSDTIAIQLLQNFFNWFTATTVWFPFMLMYNRIYPIFSPENNQRSFEDDEWGDPCMETLILLAQQLVFLLRKFAILTELIQRFLDLF